MKEFDSEVCLLTSPLLDNVSLDHLSTFFVATQDLDFSHIFLERYTRKEMFLQNPFLKNPVIHFDKAWKLAENKNVALLDQTQSQELLLHLSSQKILFLIQEFPFIESFSSELLKRTKKIITSLAKNFCGIDRECSVLFFNNRKLLQHLNLPRIRFSKKEKILLHLYLKKETEQSISDILELSLERIEKMVEELKRKFRCHNLDEMLQKAAELLVWGLL